MMADNLAESSQMNEHVPVRDAYDALVRALRELIVAVGKVLRVLDEEHREGRNVSHGETLSRGIRQSRSTGEEDPASLPISRISSEDNDDACSSSGACRQRRQ